jgi:hypothetical protein
MADLTTALPLRFADFLEQMQLTVIEQAATAFNNPTPLHVDPAHDYVELRGRWEAEGCDYFASAQLMSDGSVDLIAIEFDLDPWQLPSD